MADEPASDDKAVHRLCEALDGGDSFQSLQLLDAGDDAAATIRRFATLVKVLYFEKQDVQRMVLCGRIGIQFALETANSLHPFDAPKAESIRGQAKALAYNLGANCWPGWGDAGVTHTATDLVAGLDLARLNLRLARELNRGDEPFGHAHWLVGAMHLARREYVEATTSFTAAMEKFQAAGKTDNEQMARGYRALAEVLKDPKSSEARAVLDEALTALEAVGTEDAKFFKEQIETAERIFKSR